MTQPVPIAESRSGVIGAGPAARKTKLDQQIAKGIPPARVVRKHSGVPPQLRRSRLKYGQPHKLVGTEEHAAPTA